MAGGSQFLIMFGEIKPHHIGFSILTREIWRRNQLSKSIDQSSNSFGIGGRVEFDATEVYHQGQIKATKGPDSSHCDQCENDVKSKNIMKIHIDWYTKHTRI